MNLQKEISLTKPELVSTLLIFVLILVAVMSSRLTRLTSSSSIEFEEEIEIILSENSSLSDLQSQLDKKSIEYDKEEVDWAARLLGWRNLQRGRYVFEGNYSYNGFLSKMARGIQDPVSTVILPGITQQRLAESVSKNLNFSSEDLEEVLKDSLFLVEKELSEEELFGRMLPETYLVYWTSSPKEFVSKVLRAFNESITDEFRAKAKERGITINEVVTMASIVEWEAYNQDEKSTISGLYWNRLDRRMRLQADPTVNFALGERRRLLFEDYQVDHPFNTYINSGLPPGPITNPSLSTIEATLYPEDHEFLYMVANPVGGHVFTKTFQEHQVESEKWRIWLREQYRIKRKREAQQQAQEKETR